MDVLRFVDVMSCTLFEEGRDGERYKLGWITVL